MNTRPKKFYATTDFSCAGSTFATGDEVTGAALANALEYGEQFVVSERGAKKTTTPAVSATTEGD